MLVTIDRSRHLSGVVRERTGQDSCEIWSCEIVGLDGDGKEDSHVVLRVVLRTRTKIKIGVLLKGVKLRKIH